MIPPKCPDCASTDIRQTRRIWVEMELQGAALWPSYDSPPRYVPEYSGIVNEVDDDWEMYNCQGCGYQAADWEGFFPAESRMAVTPPGASADDPAILCP